MGTSPAFGRKSSKNSQGEKSITDHGCEKQKNESSTAALQDFPSQIEPPEEFQSAAEDSAGADSGGSSPSVKRRNKFQRSVSIGSSKEYFSLFKF